MHQLIELHDNILLALDKKQIRDRTFNLQGGYGISFVQKFCYEQHKS